MFGSELFLLAWTTHNAEAAAAAAKNEALREERWRRASPWIPAAQDLIAHVREHGGATAGFIRNKTYLRRQTEGFAVAALRLASAKFDAEPASMEVANLLGLWSRRLDFHFVGAWIDQQNGGRWEFSAVRIFSDEASALFCAGRYGERAIYNLSTDTEIWL